MSTLIIENVEIGVVMLIGKVSTKSVPKRAIIRSIPAMIIRWVKDLLLDGYRVFQ